MLFLRASHTAAGESVLLLMNVRKNSIILFSYAIIPFIDEASRLARAYPAAEAADIAR